MVSTIPLRNTVSIGMDGITQASWPDIGSDDVGAFINGLYDTGSRLSPKTLALLEGTNGANKLTSLYSAVLSTSNYGASKWDGVLANPNFQFFPQPQNSGIMGYVNNKFIFGEFNYTNDPILIAEGLASVRFAITDLSFGSLNSTPSITGLTFSADQSGVISNLGMNPPTNGSPYSSTEICLFVFGLVGTTINAYGFIFDGISSSAKNLFQLPFGSQGQAWWVDLKYQGSFNALVYQLSDPLYYVEFTPQNYTDGSGTFISTYSQIDFQQSDINDCIESIVTYWEPQPVLGYKQEFFTFAIVNQNTQKFSLILVDRGLAFYDRYDISGNDSLASQIIVNMLTTNSLYFTITYDASADLFQVCANDDDTTGSAYPIQYGTFKLSLPAKRPRVLNKFNLGCVNYCINLLKQRKLK